jgi:hypothetical protein
MAGTVIDSLIVTLGLDGSDYGKGVDKSIGSNDQLRKSSNDTANQVKKSTGTAIAGNKTLRDDADITAKYLAEKGKGASQYFSSIKVELLGLLAVVAVGGKTLEDFLSKMGRMAAATGRAAQITGTTPHLLSGLQNVAAEYGSSPDSATGAASSVFNGINNYKMTGQPNDVMNALIHMGISPVGKDGKILDTTSIIEQAGNYFKHHSEGQDLVYGKMLGFDPTFTNSLINSKGNLSDLINSQSSVSDASAAAGEAIVTAEGQLSAAIGKLDNDIMVQLAPKFIGLIDAVTALVNWFEKPKAVPAVDTTDAWIPRPGGRGGLIQNPNYSPPIDGGAGVWVPRPGGRGGTYFVPLTTDQIRAQEKQESGGRQLDANGNPITTSKGAVGIMQLLPSTAQQVAKENGIPFDLQKLQYDAGYNQKLGTLYMQDMMREFNGNYQEALAAYNAGPTATRNAINKNGTGWLASLPAETQNYVASIMGAGAPKAVASAAGLPAHVNNVLNGLRVAQAKSGKSGGDVNVNMGPTTIHTPDASKIPKNLAKKVQSAMVVNANRGIAV